MKIDRKWLTDNNACTEGKEFFLSEGILSPIAGIRNLLKKGRFNYANWLLVRLMTHKQQVQYAVFAAERVIAIYEKKYPNDDRPRSGIEAAKKFIKTGDSFPVVTPKALYAAYAAANSDAANAANASALYASYAATHAVHAAANAFYTINAANAAYAADAARSAVKAFYADNAAAFYASGAPTNTADANAVNAYAAAYAAANAANANAAARMKTRILAYGIKLISAKYKK